MKQGFHKRIGPPDEIVASDKQVVEASKPMSAPEPEEPTESEEWEVYPEIVEFCEALHSQPDPEEVYDNIPSDDFEVDNVRFIKESKIISILADELADDEYCLGCFSSWFISSHLEIDDCIISTMQEAEAFEAVGKLILHNDDMEGFAEDYASADGYGHHFNSYDGNMEELTIEGELYYVFDNR